MDPNERDLLWTDEGCEETFYFDGLDFSNSALLDGATSEAPPAHATLDPQNILCERDTSHASTTSACPTNSEEQRKPAGVAADAAVHTLANVNPRSLSDTSTWTAESVHGLHLQELASPGPIQNQIGLPHLSCIHLSSSNAPTEASCSEAPTSVDWTQVTHTGSLLRSCERAIDNTWQTPFLAAGNHAVTSSASPADPLVQPDNTVFSRHQATFASTSGSIQQNQEYSWHTLLSSTPLHANDVPLESSTLDPQGSMTSRLQSSIELPVKAVPAESELSSRSPGKVKERRSYRHEAFPRKLYRLLEETQVAGQSHIVSFTQFGKAFRVHDPPTFAKEIAPNYFRHNQYHSFQRNLSNYGFERIYCGPEIGAYTHPLFQQGHPTLCAEIRRAPELTRRRAASLSKPDQQPNQKSDHDDRPTRG